MLMVPKATEGQFDVNGSEGYWFDVKATERQFDVNGSEGY